MPKFKTISLHELVRFVHSKYESNRTYTCHIAQDIITRGEFAWAKLLEESFPGCVYTSGNKYDRGYTWKTNATRYIFDMNLVLAKDLGIAVTDPIDSHALRKILFAKLLAQPDRTLVIPC